MDMLKLEDTTTGKLSIFGYVSRGLSVPDVITTVRNLSTIHRIANDASRHARRKMGSYSPVKSLKGSVITAIPSLS